MKIHYFSDGFFFSVQVRLRHLIPHCLKCGFLLFHLRSPVGILLQADDVCAAAMKAALMCFCRLPELATPCTSAAAVVTCSALFYQDCEFLLKAAASEVIV